jgi:hypothetical protein
MGSTADRLLLPEQLTRVLLLQANDLRFGAVPHLFAMAALSFACQWESASGAGTGLQLVNTSANRLHCQSVPSAALVGDVRLTDSNAATQANIAHAAISTATLWILGWGIMALAPGFMAGTIRRRIHSVCELNHIPAHIFAVAEGLPTASDAGGSGHYFTTCSDGRLSFSVVTMVFAIRTVLVMTSLP